jgi:hypothetical protein
MKTQHALAARNIKKELSQKYPGISFGLRSKSFSMGNSVNVSWDLGPTSQEVQSVIAKYEKGIFDGTQDLYEYDHDPARDNFRNQNGSTKYALANRHIPDVFYLLMVKDLCRLNHVEFVEPYYNLRIENLKETACHIINRIMEKTSLPAGATIKGLERTNNMSAGNIEDFYRVVF